MIRFIALFLFSAALLLGTARQASAWHIIGGELTYEHLGGNTYKIILKVYRDCYSQGAEFDQPAYVGVYGSSSLTQLQLYHPGSQFLPVVLEDPCLVAPPNVCVEEAIYTYTVTFDQIPQSGITLVYQRCCRNSTILNIYDPSEVGATYTTTIYPPAVTGGSNSSPYFNNFPPIAICTNRLLEFDHSATDPDGDELVYELCAPYQGATSTVPAPTNPPPPPYQTVFFKPPYSVLDMLGGTPPMSIHPQTGLLTAFPNTVGQFVVGVCVKEYRNGNLINTHRRDFQFNIANCNPVTLARFSTMVENTPLPSDTITICGSLTVDFNNTSIGDLNRLWNFGDPSATGDTSTLKHPSYTYPDTGQYIVQLIVNPGTLCNDTAFKVINIRLGVEADFTAGPQCTHTPVSFVDQSLADDGEVVSWKWFFPNGQTATGPQPDFSFTEAGNALVRLQVETDMGCKDTVQKMVVVNPATLPNPAPRDTFVCDLDTVPLFAGAVGIAYQWSPDYELSATDVANPLAAPDVTTTYTVALTNEFNCVGRDSIVIMVTDTVIATAWPDTTICAGQVVQLFVEGGVYYQWHPQEDIFVKPFFPHKTFVKPTEPTTYYVYSFIGSCFDLDSVVITTLPVPDVQTSEAQTINQGDTVRIHATGYDAFLWSPAYSLSDPETASPLAFPLSTTSYVVTATNEYGCTDTDTTVIFVTHNHHLYVPNAFSPNGDGINDFFQFFTKGVKRILFVRVYDRWGNKVYDSEQWNGEPWNGTYKGKPAPLAVYVYVIRAETYDDTVLEERGNLTLLR